MVSWLLPYATTGLSLIAGWCLIGATPRDQPWTPVLCTFHRPSWVAQCPANSWVNLSGSPGLSSLGGMEGYSTGAIPRWRVANSPCSIAAHLPCIGYNIPVILLSTCQRHPRGQTARRPVSYHHTCCSVKRYLRILGPTLNRQGLFVARPRGPWGCHAFEAWEAWRASQSPMALPLGRLLNRALGIGLAH